MGVRVGERARVLVDVCLHSRTLEPNAVTFVTRRRWVSGPGPLPPSPLGFGTFNLVPVARDAAAHLSGPFENGLRPTLARDGWEREQEKPLPDL